MKRSPSHGRTWRKRSVPAASAGVDSALALPSASPAAAPSRPAAPAAVLARDVAFAVVVDVFGPEKRGAQAAFDVRARRAGLDARDRAFAAELAYGSIKARRRLDWLLAPYVGAREKPLPPAILDVLRLGVYQLRYMSGVDDHAAVSETVNLAWRHGHRGTAGLVNAVLRKMIADGEPALELQDCKSRDDYLGLKYSVPTWIAAQYAGAYGDACEAALRGVDAAPQYAIRVNALRTDVATVLAEFAQGDVATAVSEYVPESVIIRTGTAGDDSAGRWSVQGEAATMPVDLLDPQPGQTVLESCSGRGNKSVQIGARLAGSGNLVCVEIDERKIRVLRETLERADVTNVAIVAGDARSAASDVRADAVLLDAPCSGTGVIGRHPEARWRKLPSDGERLAHVQAELLDAAAERTAPGGRLVYSVCSTDVREGRAIIDAFLKARPAFARLAVPLRYAAFASDGDVVVPAGIEGRDGFFIALLGRERSAA